MGKIAVVFKSKYGAAKKYAQWIAEEVQGDLIENSNISVKTLMSYDTIVYGGGLYAGGIYGFSLIKKNYEKLENKKIIVFSVGTSKYKEDTETEVKRVNFSKEMQNNVKLFFLRGSLDYKKMNMVDRLLMFMLKKMCEKKTDEDSKRIVASYGKTVDFTNKDSIKPIVKYILD